MAILNIWIDDQVRDQLTELADRRGESTDEFVRNLMMAAVVPDYGPEVVHGEEPPAESMRIVDRQVLSLLHRILGRVLPPDANDVDGDLEYQLMRAKILEHGFTGEYWYETSGFNTELSKLDCRRVSDILHMHRVLTYSINDLMEKGEPVPEKMARSLEFHGFDHNDALEGHMADYVEFLMRGGDRWSELQPQLERSDFGNSHMPALDTYLRMLSEFRRIMDSRESGTHRHDYLLSLEEMELIAAAQIHPSRRDTRASGERG